MELAQLKKHSRTKKLLKKYWPVYLMILPGLLYFLVFKYGPMYGITIAFKDYASRKGIMGSPWADPWYKYFKQFFESPYATRVIVNTVSISLYKIMFGMFPPIILAILINECKSSKYKKVVQTVTYLPHFLSWVIIYGILLALFSQSSGIINNWIRELGGESVPFLTSPKTFRSMVVGSGIWKEAGWGTIMYLAAMANIDPTLYEAASIDGCTRVKRILKITLPCLRSIFLMSLILRMGTVLDAGFDQLYIMLNDNVTSVGEIIDTWSFKQGLIRMNYSLGTAIGLLKSVIALSMVILTNKLAKKWGENIW